jgi:hypothetical protein
VSDYSRLCSHGTDETPGGGAVLMNQINASLLKRVASLDECDWMDSLDVQDETSWLDTAFNRAHVPSSAAVEAMERRAREAAKWEWEDSITTRSTTSNGPGSPWGDLDLLGSAGRGRTTSMRTASLVREVSRLGVGTAT